MLRKLFKQIESWHRTYELWDLRAEANVCIRRIKRDYIYYGEVTCKTMYSDTLIVDPDGYYNGRLDIALKHVINTYYNGYLEIRSIEDVQNFAKLLRNAVEDYINNMLTRRMEVEC